MKKSPYTMKLVDSDITNHNKLDYLILASGSDRRAYEVLSKYVSDSKTKVLLFHFKERVLGLNTDNPLFNYKKFAAENMQELSCDIKNPSSCLEALLENDFTNTDKIGVDISCLTKPYFYFILKLLKERFNIEHIKAFYTEPKSYLFPKGLCSAFQSSNGPLSILEMQGYTGIESRGSSRKLIILLGFDGDLSKEINEDVSPSETIVVNGFPSYIPKFKDFSIIANEKLVSDHNIDVVYARANNPFDTYNLLHRLQKEADANTFINIAPLGTKPMALGACLFALHHPSVRIVYPLPENYEKKYSDRSWNTWLYELPLLN